MRTDLMRGTAAALLLLAGTAFANAENQPGANQAQGTSEPSAHANQAPPEPVFVNGKLAVPGAPADSQTEPAKFSAKNDADDKVSLSAITLSADERSALYRQLGAGRETTGTGNAGDPAYAHVSFVLPAGTETQPLPQDIARAMPDIAAYRYARAGSKMLLIEPTKDVVVAVVEG